MPNPYVNKVTANGQTLIDLTEDTAIASDVASGKYFHLATGERVAGTASGGGDTYTRTVIAPQQTITPNSSRSFNFTYSSAFVDGEYYVVTLDGVEWIATAETIWDNETVIGDASVPWNTSDTAYPFVMSSGVGYVTDTNQHTLKVEHLEFVDGPLNLIAKSITTNGTYVASSDNADGYSSVTVNVPSSGGTYQAKANISPTTSSQTILPDSGYDALSSVQINAMPTMTLPSSPDSSHTGSPKGTINVSSAGQRYLNIPAGYNDTARYYTIQPVLLESPTLTANGTYYASDWDSHGLEQVTVAIPIVTYHTSSSAPTSSQGSDGDLWLVTV